MGRPLSKPPTDVHLGKFLLIATTFCFLDPALTIAATLSSKSPFLLVHSSPIPGYSPPDPISIRRWAVKQINKFCQEYNLPELWAYLWENWYRTDRWGLWARSAYPEIPRLKTAMMVEAQ